MQTPLRPQTTALIALACGVGATLLAWLIVGMHAEKVGEAAFGLDLRSRSAAAAAERSRDTGEATMTARYRLAQETAGSFGLVIYLPVLGPQRPRTPAQRRQALLGFVNVVLRVDDMMADM